MSALASERARMQADLLALAGESIIYTPVGGPGTSMIVVLSEGQRVEDAKPGAHASFWAPLASFPAEPQKSDRVSVPVGRAIAAGEYRVSDWERAGLNTRTVYLEYIHRP